MSLIEIDHPYTPHKYQSELHGLLSKHRFGVVVAHRRFGKTMWAVNAIIHAALFGNKPDMRFAYIAPYYGQAKQVAWDYFKQFTYMVPEVRFNESELRVDFPNGARIKLYGGDNPDALRGIYLDGVVLDEVADMRANVWAEVIRPTLTDRQGWAVFIGTPKGINLFYDIYTQAQEAPGWFAVTYRADQTGLIDHGELASARREMTQEKYAQEFLCDFSVSDDSAVISLALAVEASNRRINDVEVQGAIRVIGVDVAGANTGRDKTVIFPVQGLKAHNPIILEGADTNDIVNRLIGITNTYKPDYVRIDMGFGHGVFDIYKSYGYKAQGVHFGGAARESGYYANVRAEIWDGTRKWLEAGGSIPKHEQLIKELASVKRKPETGTHRMMLESKKNMDKSPDIADALCLAVGVPLWHPEARGAAIKTKPSVITTKKRFETKKVLR